MIIRAPTPPVDTNHGMFHYMSPRFLYSDVLLDPAGAGMWLFDPRIVELRKSNNFFVKIISHPDTEVADRSFRLVLIDESLPTHPIPIATPANIKVRFEIKRKGIVRVESLDVGTLSVTTPKPNVRHAVIRRDEVGDVVIYKRSGGAGVAYVRKENESDGESYLPKSDLCVLL